MRLIDLDFQSNDTDYPAGYVPVNRYYTAVHEGFCYVWMPKKKYTVIVTHNALNTCKVLTLPPALLAFMLIKYPR